jgi:hypothetical protein
MKPDSLVSLVLLSGIPLSIIVAMAFVIRGWYSKDKK